MIIKRVLNNNTVISKNSQNVDVLLIGKGIGFGMNKGAKVKVELIEKSFVLKNTDMQDKFTQLLIDVPTELILAVEKIINFGKIKLAKSLNESIYVNLTDHIHSAIQRYKEGIIVRNPLRWDISRFYPDEYAVGEKAVEIIKSDLGFDLEIDEAAFIAIHFVNADISNTGDMAYQVAEITKDIEDIVKDHYRTEFDEGSLDYYRFITHLKFFAQRLLSNTHYDDEDDELIETLQYKYQSQYQCSLKIKDYIEDRFQYSLSATEILYLTVHIRRLTKHL